MNSKSKLFAKITMFIAILGLANICYSQPQSPNNGGLIAERIQTENGVTFQLTETSVNNNWVVIPKKTHVVAVENVLKKYNVSYNHLKNANTFIVKTDVSSINLIKKQLTEESSAQFVGPDKLVYINEIVTPNDPLWSQQWDMLDVNMPSVWGRSVGDGNIIVAVIDTGIDPHPDLIDNLYVDPVDGSYGWESFGGVLKPTFKDYYGHGTHCAGTIAAVGNNELGMAGMNWDVTVMAFSFLSAGGSGSLSDAIIVIDKIVELKKAGMNIRVTSNSWGGSGTDPALTAAFQSLEDNGIISLAAAGNGYRNDDLYEYQPAGLPNRGLITVQAHDVNSVKAGFSNWGLITTDISAPGVSVLSTMSTNPAVRLTDPTGYGLLSGTSMATPHVAGLAAYLLALNPSLTVYELRDLILSKASVTPMTGLSSLSTTSGKMDVLKASENPMLTTPRTNNIPVLVGNTTQEVNAGETITVTSVATDADGDLLNYVVYDPAGNYVNSNIVQFTTPFIPFDACFPFVQGVADYNGGSAKNSFLINVYSDPTRQYDDYSFKLKDFTQVPWEYDPTNYVMIGYTTEYITHTKPEVSAMWRSYMASRGTIQGTWNGGMKIGNGTRTAFLGRTNTYVRVMAFAENTERTLRDSDKILSWTGPGEAPADPGFPTIDVQLDKMSGPSPLVINYDATTSATPNGLRSLYVYMDGASYGMVAPLKGQLTFTKPGIQTVEFLIADNLSYMDLTFKNISVLAPTDNTCIPPTVITQPKSQSVEEGDPVTFSTVANGTTLSFQWHFNGVDIADATNSSYSISSVALTDAGDYNVTVSNECGTVDSSVATLEVTTPPPPPEIPVVTKQPVGASLIEGQSLSLSVEATGTAPLSYQWYLNSTPVSGATSDTYTKSSVTTDDAGSYYVKVSNVAGSVNSSTATVTVTPLDRLVAVTNLAGTVSGTSFNLTWTDKSIGETGYQVWMSYKHKGKVTAYKMVEPLGANAQSYIYATQPGFNGPQYIYYFKVNAISETETAPDSNILQLKTK